MKKIISSLLFAAVAVAGYAQATQQYLRVEFNRPMTPYDAVKTDKPGSAVSQSMKDNYIYVNPQHQYLDFNVTDNQMKFRANGNAYYLHQVRNTQSYIEDNNMQMPYLADCISAITQYSLPVERVELIDSVPAKEVMMEGEKIPFRISEFTFNRLPRNVAELKTLIEPNGDGKRKHCHNPEFVVAAMYLVIPRLLDCSQDCRDMIDYLCGKWNDSRGKNKTISNTDFQDICISSYTGGGTGEVGGGKDSNGLYWDSNHLYQWFDGATPHNQYHPNNGKDYNVGPYKVYVCREVNPAANGVGYKYYLISHPYETNKGLRAMESATACPVFVKATDEGFFIEQNMKNYFARGKAQINPDL